MSQGSVVLPTSGVVSGATFAADVNAGFDAVRTSWAGGSAPSSDTPEEGQHWLDTSVAGAITMKLYTGSAWVALYTILTSSNTVVTGLQSSLTTVNDATYNMAASDRNIAYTAITAARVVNLVAANSYPAGTEVCIYDDSGSCSTTNTITVTRAGSDTIDGPLGAQTTWVISAAYGYVRLKSDGTSKWIVVGSTGISFLSPRQISTSYAVATLDAGVTLALTSTASSITITFNSSTGYAASHATKINNISSRGHMIASTSLGNTWLYPGEEIIYSNSTGSTTWRASRGIVTVNGNQYFAGKKVTALWPNPSFCYGSTSGSDTANDGLTSTAPWQTPYQGIQFSYQLADAGGSNQNRVSMQLSSGRYQSPSGGGWFINGQITGGHLMNFTGLGATPSATQLVSSGQNSIFTLNDNVAVTFNNVELAGVEAGAGTNASSSASGLICARNVVVDLNNVTFGAFINGTPLIMQDAAIVSLVAACDIEPGGCISFAQVNRGGSLDFSGSTYTNASNTQNSYQNGFIYASGAGACVTIDSGANFAAFLSTGSSDIGKTFVISMNATLFRNGVQLPGNATGTATNGAQFT